MATVTKSASRGHASSRLVVLAKTLCICQRQTSGIYPRDPGSTPGYKIKNIPRWCSGSTAGSDPASLGSSPGLGALSVSVER